MPLLVTGSIGIDTIRTPHGSSENCLGGSSVYFSMAASLFAPVRFVGVVGEDCPFDLPEIFKGRDVDLRGLEVRSGSKTFVWHGTYHENMNDRTTDRVELNVLLEAPPKVPAGVPDSRFLFLANTAPALQMELLARSRRDFRGRRHHGPLDHGPAADLQELLKKIHCLIVNDEEARLLAGRLNLIEAAEAILVMGPRIVIVKKGEAGSLMCLADGNNSSCRPSRPPRSATRPAQATASPAD